MLKTLIPNRRSLSSVSPDLLLSSPGREEVSHNVITPVEDLSLPPLLQASLPLLPPVLQDSRGTVFLLEMNH